MDYFKLKNGDSTFGIDLRDFIVRRISLKQVEQSSEYSDQEFLDDLAHPSSLMAHLVICPHSDFVKVFNVRGLTHTFLKYHLQDQKRDQSKLYDLILYLMPSIAQKSFNKRQQILNSFQEFVNNIKFTIIIIGICPRNHFGVRREPSEIHLPHS